MKRKIIVIFVLTLLFSVSVLADEAADAKSAVQSFYKIQTFSNDGFSVQLINKRKSWFTAELYNTYVQTVRLEDAWEKKHPDEKPEFWGLGFHPDPEMYPQIPVIGKSSVKGEMALVDVNFYYIEKKKRTFHDKYVIELKKQGAKWLINDIIYDGQGRISGLMKKYIKEQSPKPKTN
jgi:hypothetical protein